MITNRVVFAVVFFLNVFLLTAGSSGAVPFGKHIYDYIHY